MYKIWLLVVLLVLSSCAQEQARSTEESAQLLLPEAKQTISIVSQRQPFVYVAVGDSYTYGQSVPENESWPAILSTKLNTAGIPVVLKERAARTGWSTKQVIERALPSYESHNPDFATLQIGVNDWVGGVSEENFRLRFNIILGRMIAKLPSKERLLVLTVPDFGVTPEGYQYSGGRNISEGILRLNGIIKEEAGKREIVVIDIFSTSKLALNNRSHVAPDGLHPSGIQYALWAELVYPEAVAILNQS